MIYYIKVDGGQICFKHKSRLIKSIRVNGVYIYLSVYHGIQHWVHPSDRIRVDIADIYLVPNKGSDIFYSGIRWTGFIKNKTGRSVGFRTLGR